MRLVSLIALVVVEKPLTNSQGTVAQSVKRLYIADKDHLPTFFDSPMSSPPNMWKPLIAGLGLLGLGGVLMFRHMRQESAYD